MKTFSLLNQGFAPISQCSTVLGPGKMASVSFPSLLSELPMHVPFWWALRQPFVSPSSCMSYISHRHLSFNRTCKTITAFRAWLSDQRILQNHLNILVNGHDLMGCSFWVMQKLRLYFIQSFIYGLKQSNMEVSVTDVVQVFRVPRHFSEPCPPHQPPVEDSLVACP